MFTNGLPYHLSDHFAIYGIVDLHESHESRAKRAECEGRRADLGKLRDALALEERAAVTQLEQVALDRDKAEQMRMAEEQLADALRREQRTLERGTGGARPCGRASMARMHCSAKASTSPWPA